MPISEKNWYILSAVHAENKSPRDNHAYIIHFLKPGLTKVLDSIYTDLDKNFGTDKNLHGSAFRLYGVIQDPPLTLQVFERQSTLYKFWTWSEVDQNFWKFVRTVYVNGYYSGLHTISSGFLGRTIWRQSFPVFGSLRYQSARHVKKRY